MKHFYIIVFFLISSSVFAQGVSKTTDIPGFSMYPNPVTNSRVYITTANNGPKDVKIYDVLGTLVLQTVILGKEVNLNNLDAGVYVIRVIEKNKVATRKLVIK